LATSVLARGSQQADTSGWTQLDAHRSAWEQLHPSAEAEQSLSLELPMNPHTTQYVADYLSGSHAADNPLDYILSMLPIRPERITPLGMAELHLNKVSDLLTLLTTLCLGLRAHAPKIPACADR
jgi:hypothetical protein